MKKKSKITEWSIGVLFTLFAVCNGFHWSSLLLLASAFFVMPISKIRSALLQIKIGNIQLKKWMIIALASALFVIGVLLSPSAGQPLDIEDLPNYSESGNSDTYEESESDKENTNDISYEVGTNDENNDVLEDNPKDESESFPSTPTSPEDVEVPELSVGKETVVPVNPSQLPLYSGNPYVIVENNIPSFSGAELTAIGYEKYSPLDSYGRCGVAIASCGKEIMPRADEERGSISSIKPSGWIQASYSGVSGGYLWNRCHLIGWQLSAENANRQNLITGTRYMNVSGMLPFENMIADYIKETDNHVAFRVTPIFEGNNLVCSGVQMEAYSIEDNGRGICFNVYCYNVQPGIIIDYATGESSNANEKNNSNTDIDKEQSNSKEDNSNVENDNEANQQMVWIPKSGKKYHSNSRCSNMKNPSKVTIEEAKKQNYTPCSKCY